METLRSCSLFSLLLLTFTGSILACGNDRRSDSGYLGRDYCPANPFDYSYGSKIWLADASSQSLFQNGATSEQPNTKNVDVDSKAPPSPLYTIAPLPSKGLGLLALLPIPRGTRILLESPLLTVPMPSFSPGRGFSLTTMLDSLSTSFSLLSPTQQALFLSLHNHRFPGDESTSPPQSNLLTIFRSNAYNTGSSHVGLFPLIARINHDCRPNSVNYWSERMRKRIIYAGRDIQAGEEITVSYIPLLKSVKERRGRLAQYGFECACEACRDEESGKRRGKIADLMDVLEGKVEVKSEKIMVNEKLVKRVERLVALLREERLVEVEYWAKAAGFGAVFSRRAKNLEEARRWKEMELEELRLAEEDSDEVVQAVEFLDRLER